MLSGRSLTLGLSVDTGAPAGRSFGGEALYRAITASTAGALPR